MNMPWLQVGAILEPSGTLGSKQSRGGAASTHRDVGPDGDDDAVLDVDVGGLRPVRVHHRAALDQDPRAVPSAAAAGVTPRRAELVRRMRRRHGDGEERQQQEESAGGRRHGPRCRRSGRVEKQSG